MSRRRYHPVRLAMYDWPEVRRETASLERALHDAIQDALDLDPDDLIPWPDGIGEADIWQQPGVLLTQTCGYPLTHALTGKVRLLGAPHYSAEGCKGPRYCSHLIVHRDSPFGQLQDLKGKRAAFNGPDSQSGMNTFRHAVSRIAGGKAFFSEVTRSGGHLASMRSVAEGKADVASIDAVCWGLACQEIPELTGQLRPIAQTAPASGLPFITSLQYSQVEADLIAETVKAVLSSPETAKNRERLGIRGFSILSLDDYEGILLMEQEAEALGYPALA
ncbi:MAG: PhnD/SsuA/transferrin family substrate-binding protein [Pseudomonadota bacterium]